jgi:hypothetical protein
MVVNTIDNCNMDSSIYLRQSLVACWNCQNWTAIESNSVSKNFPYVNIDIAFLS